MSYRMKYWNKGYFQSFFEMDEEEYESLKGRGRLNAQMQNGKEVVDIDAVYLPRKFQDKVEKLSKLDS